MARMKSEAQDLGLKTRSFSYEELVRWSDLFVDGLGRLDTVRAVRAAQVGVGVFFLLGEQIFGKLGTAPPPPGPVGPARPLGRRPFGLLGKRTLRRRPLGRASGLVHARGGLRLSRLQHILPLRPASQAGLGAGRNKKCLAPSQLGKFSY